MAQMDGVLGLTLYCDDFETRSQEDEPLADGLISSSEDIVHVMADYLTTLNNFVKGIITLNVPDHTSRTKPQKRQNDSTNNADSGDETSTSDDGEDDGSGDSDADADIDTDFTTDGTQLLADYLAWQYQFCSQFGQRTYRPGPSQLLMSDTGFFIGNDPASNNSLLSQFVSTAAIQTECSETFKGLNVSIPAQPQISQVLKYGGWNMTPAQTFFTHGERTSVPCTCSVLSV